jgi:cellulose synthase/poly-beta-1,6-N-acetylglucosamine synthase-like glycosyltransferase
MANGNLVEDLTLGIDLASAGYPPRYVPSAQVISYFPTSENAHQAQRQRWEHGHLSMILGRTGALLKQAIRDKNAKLFWMVWDMTVPPLSFLTLLILLTLVGGTLLTLLSQNTALAILPLLVSGLFLLVVGIAWARYGREILNPLHLFAVPFYLLRKLPLYWRFFISRQKAWIRTSRDK